MVTIITSGTFKLTFFIL